MRTGVMRTIVRKSFAISPHKRNIYNIKEDKKRMRPKVMLVGFGIFGKVHYAALKLLEDQGKLTILCVVDSDPKKLLGIANGYSNFEEALALNPDIVCISTNTALHYTQLCTILEKNFEKKSSYPSLFIEKPIVETLEEALAIKRKFDSINFFDTAVCSCGYLIRFSKALKGALEYIQSQKAAIKSFDVVWQKKREPIRPSAGIHIDETTHAVDVIINYILPRLGIAVQKITITNLEPIYSLEIVDPIIQKKLYGNMSAVPMAQLSYNLLINNIPLQGFSSFIQSPMKRTIQIYLHNGDYMCVHFDKEGYDVIEINGVIKGTFSCLGKHGRVYLEWKSFLEYYSTKKKSDLLASLDDAIVDIAITEKLGDKHLNIPFSFSMKNLQL